LNLRTRDLETARLRRDNILAGRCFQTLHTQAA
jgi:hypothetical protein